MTTFVHVGDALQLAYSPARQALGEYVSWPGPGGASHWRFMGWLWEGEIKSVEQAREKAAEYAGAVG